MVFYMWCLLATMVTDVAIVVTTKLRMPTIAVTSGLLTMKCHNLVLQGFSSDIQAQC